MVPRQETISVVIPTWKGREHLASLLPSLVAQTLQPLEVMVIDGASADGSREISISLGARFVELDRNAGFAVAVNAGLSLAKGQFAAVLNNDIKLDSRWLERLIAVNAPFACGKVLQWERPTHIDATWDLLSASGVPLRCGHGKKDGQYWNRSRAISLAPWTAILLRRDYWRAVGDLDESFESYLEDVDYGLRGAELGFSGTYVPEAIAWHRGSATLGEWHPRQVRLSSRNQLLLIAKHGGRQWFQRFGREVLFGQLLWGIAAARRGQGRAWLSGKFEALQQKEKVQWTAKREQLLHDLNSEIFALEAATGMERFWRYYWAQL